jgi:nucleotide-binding universal stress UspA family protein
MMKSVLAISEGGPDAAMAFRLAAVVAADFGAIVDGVHFPLGRPDDINIAAQAMPFLKDQGRSRLTGRLHNTEGAWREHAAAIAGATLRTGWDTTLDMLVAMGRSADLLIVGRPGMDPENTAPATVHAAIHDCARPVMVAPPDPHVRRLSSVVIAWNGSAQAARAVEYALPFLARADKVTILVAGATPDAVSVPLLVRHLGRHGIAAAVDAVDPGAVSGRARGRALLGYVGDRNIDLLVMGAYGGGQLSGFLGLGGATGKVISSCPVPVLLAH